MAKSQGSGLSWMIASAVLGIAFFFTMILAIIFFTRISAAEQQAQSDRETLNVWVSAVERNSPDMLPLVDAAKEERVSVISKFRENARWLKETMGVGSDTANAEITQKLTTAGVTDGSNMLSTIVGLKAQTSNDRQQLDQFELDLAKERENARQAVDAQQKVAASYNESSAKLKGELTSMSSEFMGFKDQTTSSANALIGTVDKERKESLETIATQKSTIAQYEKQNAILQHQLESLRSERDRLTGTIDPSLLPDGRISSVLSDSRVVYIDLGRNDHIVLGMTFEVYDSGSGVVKDERGDIRGKSTLEVVNVLDNASVCRVVRRDPGRELIVGDIVANVVYDPRMKFNFYIFGDFDLDDTGQTTLTDRRRIEGMIAAWGGKVVSNRRSGDEGLKPETDFLVLGEEPPLPTEPLDKTDPVTIENYNKAKAKYETYQNLMVEAKKLSIPVLNQNRFLTMVGYYQR